MEKLRVAWNKEEEIENIKKYSVDFKIAKEVVLNSSSLRVHNVLKDFNFIGPVDDLSKILVVATILEGEYRKIRLARKATPKEESAYFNHLAMGGLV